MFRNSNNTRTVGVKVTVLILVIVVIICSTLGIVSYFSSSSALRDNIIQSIECRAVDNAEHIAAEINTLKKNIEMVSYWMSFSPLDLETVMPSLADISMRAGIDRFQVIDLRGIATSTNGNTADISDRDYFIRALKGETSVSGPYKSRLDGNMAIVCATPIKNIDGQMIGVLTASLKSDYLFKIIENKKVGRTGYGFMINKEGMIIAHPNPKMILSKENEITQLEKNPELRELAIYIRKMMNGEAGNGFYSFNGIDKFMAYAPISDTGWTVVLSVPRHEVFFQLDVIRNRFIILTLIAIFVSSSCLFLLFKFLYQREEIGVIRENANENARLLKESIELDRLKTEFFTNISHELRTPLNLILGTLQLFDLYLKNGLPMAIEKLSNHIGSMKQNGLRLVRLIDNIIDASKIDSGFYTINLHNHNVVDIVRDVTNLVSDYVKSKNLYLEFTTDVENIFMACDVDKIERIMLNLLSNAVKFTDQGGSIFVNIYDQGDKVVIIVKDTGIGIPFDKQDMIFERFNQVDRSLTRGHEGSGIGLSIVKSLVLMHNGKISVKSDYGCGSEFIIELPVKLINVEKPNIKERELSFRQDTLSNKICVEFSDIKM